MPPLSQSELRRLCQAAEPSDLLGFIADLYAARGWTVASKDASDGVITLERDGVLQSLGVATETTVPDGVDIVVIIGAEVDPAAITADTSLDVGDLRNLLLYSIDREQAATVFERWFDQPLSAPDRTGQPVDSHAASRDDPAQGEMAAPEPAAPAGAATHAAESATDGPQPPTESEPTDTSNPIRNRRYLGLAVGLVLVVGVVVGAAGIGLSVTDPAADNDTTADTTADSEFTPVPTTGTLSTAIQAASTSEQLASAQPTQIPAESTAFPPGVDRTGITDYQQLVDAHESQLEGRSYRITLSYREVRDGTVTGARTQTVRVENRTTYHATSTEFGRVVSPSPSLGDGDVYANGSVEFERTSTGVTRRPLRGPDSYRTSLSRYLDWYLSVNESRAVAASAEGPTSTIRVATDGDPYPGVTDATGTATVTESGLVTHLYRTHARPDSQVRIVITLRVTDVGTTTVSAPEWAGERASNDGVSSGS